MFKASSRILTIFLGGSGVLLLQYALARLVPITALFFYLPTAIGLEVLENHGLPTLQGSPDGWPVPTTYGWYIAVVGWWLVWSLVLAVVRASPNYSFKGNSHRTDVCPLNSSVRRTDFLRFQWLCAQCLAP